ncbi:coenzyme F420-0:L-glutamate ligase [Methanothermococcus sp. SCGC AD-155-K20]|nr:coenzyme F420-0:L-glutamate ligase [Methanothermococcus sp. SCGC AD-155-K20]
MNIHPIPIESKYIKKGENHINEIINSLKREINKGLNIEDGDFIIVSEKFVATGENNLIDESNVKVGFWAYFCYYWSKYIWGYILGPLLKTRPDRIKNIRKMPKRETLKHKQTVINYVGLRYALKPASEGGVDLTNVPGTYAALLPKDPQKSAEKIYYAIKKELNLDVVVMIIDTDATYKFFKWYITALPCGIEGIISKIGVLGYILGKLAGLLKVGGLCGATPLAIAGNSIYKKYSMDEILYIANMADRSQGEPTKSIHNIMKEYNTFEITEEILEKLSHKPIVFVKNIKDNGENEHKG